jgi:thiol:disulfide interchange protein DsbA
MKRVICLVLLILSTPLNAASFVPVSGQHYRILEQVPAHVSQTGVTELFWYGCDYCRQFHYASQVLRQQYSDLDWRYLPVVMRPEWRRHAKLHYLIAEQPQFATLHEGLYERLAENPEAFTDDEELQAWLQSYGVDAEDITARLRDYRLNAQLRQDLDTVNVISLRGVPALIVAGRYLVDASMVSDMGQYMATLSHLLQFVPPPSP